MQLGILGTLEVRGPDGLIEVSGARLRRLLVRLSADAGRTVSVHELVDAIWPDDEPADAANALQTLVSRLRRTLHDPAAIHQANGGYRLQVAADDVDTVRFRTLARDGLELLNAGDTSAARSTLGKALALWRGEALADAGDADYAVAVVARLEEQRLEALANRIEADLALGEAGVLVGELEELSHTYPLREVFTGQLMRALAASGRTSEALSTFERLRTTLAETLGTDPSPAIRDLHVSLLRHGGVATAIPARRRSNVRAGLTTFLGRDAEKDRIRDLLHSNRLTTVVGPGGAGKTRIASEVGGTWLEEAPDGVWLVELAPVSDPANLVQAFLGALDLRETHIIDRARELFVTRDDMALLIGALAGSKALLIVDNCEHLIDATARLVGDLLAGCPDLRILATSREPLGIDGESLCVLPPLGLPPVDATAEQAATYPSVQLFVDRASAVRAGFALDDSTVGDVIEIVRRLDGLPLAIELASARTRILPVSEVAARLSDRFRLLTGGSRTAMPRHQTLRAVVEWSWDLLSPTERLLAERLAVFPAGATTETAAEICGDDQLAEADVPDLLDSLVDKSLLTLVGDTAVRYRMLETIREFGVERLGERGEVAEARRRHATWFADLVERMSPDLRTGSQLTVVATLEAERENILAALRYLGDSGDAQGAITLAGDLSWYWSLLDNHTEATTWLEFALAVPGETDRGDRLIAEASLLLYRVMGGPDFDDMAAGEAQMADVSRQLEELVASEQRPPFVVMLRASMAFFSGQEEVANAIITRGIEEGDAWVRAALRMLRANMAENDGNVGQMREDVAAALGEFTEIGDAWGISSVLSVNAQLQTLDGDLEDAIASYELAASHLESLGARTDQALIGMRLSAVRMRVGDWEGARADIERFSREEIGGVGELFGVAMSAMLALQTGDLDAMRDLRAVLQQSVEERRSPHGLHEHARALVHSIVGLLLLADGDVAGAHEAALAAYPVTVATTDMPIVANFGVLAASLAAQRGEPEEAAEQLGAAAMLRGAEDPTDPIIRALMQRLVGELGKEPFATAYERGRSLSRTDAIARLAPPGWTEESSRAT